MPMSSYEINFLIMSQEIWIMTQVQRDLAIYVCL